MRRVALNLGQQFGGVEGLNDEVGGAGVQAGLDEIHLLLLGQQQDRGVAPGGQFTDGTNEAAVVVLQEADIEKHGQRRGHVPQHVAGGGAAFRGDDLVALAAEHVVQEIGGVGILLDDEQGFPDLFYRHARFYRD